MNYTSLYDIVRHGDYEELEDEINTGENPDKEYFHGMSLLHGVCVCDDFYAVKKMLHFLIGKHYVYVNTQNNFGQTPLHLAVSRNNLALVKLLVLLYYADVYIEDDDGRTAEDYANKRNIKNFLYEAARNPLIFDTNSCKF